MLLPSTVYFGTFLTAHNSVLRISQMKTVNQPYCQAFTRFFKKLFNHFSKIPNEEIPKRHENTLGFDNKGEPVYVVTGSEAESAAKRNPNKQIRHIPASPKRKME
jgi:hypothetical protein